MDIEKAPPDASNRRALLRGAGAGALGLGALAAGMRPSAADTAPIIVDILNFALNLEYLEAEFYLRAATGQGIDVADTTGIGRQGFVAGGRRVAFTTLRLARIAADIAQDEVSHVRFLRAMLGASAVAEPRINLVSGFTVLARLAGLGGKFDPFKDESSFLLGAYMLEDVGVTAYGGALGYLAGTPTALAAAAGFLATEAYHAGSIRSQMILTGTGLVAMADKVSRVRSLLSGAQDDVGPFNGTTANVANADANGLAFARSPQQVLNIVYGGGAANNYLFFPNKLNGNIS